MPNIFTFAPKIPKGENIGFINHPVMDTVLNKLFPEFPPVTTREWEEKILEDLKGADYAKKLIWKTPEGFDVKPYYREEDLSSVSYLESMPGEFPFVRGNSYGKNSWEIRQNIEITDLKDANHFALDALRRGAGGVGLWVLKVKTVNHLETLLKGMCLGECNVHLEGSSCYPDIVNLVAEYIRKHHLNAAAFHGSLNFDPIGYLLLEGDFWKSEEYDLGQVGQMVELGMQNIPNFKVININAQHFHNSGANIVQELAFGLASGNEYLARYTDSGGKVDDIAVRTGFTFATGSNYFLEIAKLRAARLLWSQIVKQYNPADEKSGKMYIQSTTSSFNKSIFDPYVNLLRSTTEAMSAIIGGADSLTITPFDLFYKNPDEFSNRIARNQQVILKEEAYLEEVSDPAAGSYYIENLTDSIARAAWDLFREVEKSGGLLEAIKSGFVQDEVKKQAAQFRNDVASRRIIVLGTNQYPNLQEKMLEKIQTEEPAGEEPAEKTSTFKKLELSRLTDEFDDLRLATELYTEDGNPRPSVFLFTYGNLAMRKARAMFTTNFFGCAGYDIIDNPGFKTIEEGIEAALASPSEIVVICSSDDEYASVAPAIASGIKENNKEKLVIVAGYPKEILDSLKTSGVDDFIHVRTNVLEFLRGMNSKLNITE